MNVTPVKLNGINVVEYNPVCLDVILKVRFSFTTRSGMQTQICQLAPPPQPPSLGKWATTFENALREIAFVFLSLYPSNIKVQSDVTLIA